MKDQEKIHLSQLFEKKLEGTLSQSEAVELEKLTLNNKEAADLYYDLCIQHIGLEEHKQSLEGNNIIPFEPDRNNIVLRLFPVVLAASVLLALSLIIVITQNNQIKSIGILSQVNHCVWSESSLPTIKGSELQPGTMKLKKGLAEIQLNSGVYFQIEAPAHIELLSDMHCVVHNGSVMADVPDRAKGFTIDTPSAKVIDHGTKFIVRHQPDSKNNSSYIEVLEGEVEVQGHDMKKSQHIFTGDSIVANKSGISSDVPSEGLSPELSPLNTYHLSSSDGRGEEATVITSNDYNFHYIPSMILIKNSSQGTLNRKGYLKFDLDKLPNKNFKDVKLSFNMLPTYLGTTVNLTTPTFKIYGLLEKHDDWKTQELSYQNAPGNVEEGNKVNSNDTTYLGSFRMEKGEVEATKYMSSSELNKFIRNDNNGLISIIIVREERGQGSVDSIIHGFANSKHPSASPPKLIFNY